MQAREYKFTYRPIAGTENIMADSLKLTLKNPIISLSLYPLHDNDGEITEGLPV